MFDLISWFTKSQNLKKTRTLSLQPQRLWPFSKGTTRPPLIPNFTVTIGSGDYQRFTSNLPAIVRPHQNQQMGIVNPREPQCDSWPINSNQGQVLDVREWTQFMHAREGGTRQGHSAGVMVQILIKLDWQGCSEVLSVCIGLNEGRVAVKCGEGFLVQNRVSIAVA